MLQSRPVSLDHFEEAVNEISDRESSWWPFLWLRPAKHAELSLTRIALLSVLYGLPCSALMSVVLSVCRPSVPSEIVTTAFAFPLLFLFCGSVIVAPMWNRRAARVRARARE